MIKYFYSSLVVIAFVGLFTSCVDNTIDEPPVKDFPVLDANATIQDLLDMWVPGQILEITDDLVIDAVVVADRAGEHVHAFAFGTHSLPKPGIVRRQQWQPPR